MNFLFDTVHEDAKLKATDFGLSVFYKPGWPFVEAAEKFRKEFGTEPDIDLAAITGRMAVKKAVQNNSDRIYVLTNICIAWLYILSSIGLRSSKMGSCCTWATSVFIPTFDAIDGKQLERTNSSIPLGELFDHGCDALACALEALAFGSTAIYIFWGNLGVVCTIPLDTAKVRLQLQKQVVAGDVSSLPKYNGMLGTVGTIAREEGLSALWKGIVLGLHRQCLYGGLRIGLYEPVKTFYTGKDHVGDVPLSKKILSAFTTGE
ncbi:hypothetical protein P8452_14316 [Trifolium repens]|nr:hypothetical protein P8452_14316 [Trifolium repens]